MLECVHTMWEPIAGGVDRSEVPVRQQQCHNPGLGYAALALVDFKRYAPRPG